MDSDCPFEYKTIAREARTELQVEGSRFIASARRITSKGDAERHLREIRGEYHDATHNAYAYRLGLDRTLFRTSDDGEPSRTAGRPILSMLDKYRLTNLLVVVTRYFGGKKLGRGGLARAYAGAAESVLKDSGTVTVSVIQEVRLIFPYTYIAPVMQVLSVVGARILDADYVDEVKLKIGVPAQKIEVLKKSVVQVTHGNIELG